MLFAQLPPGTGVHCAPPYHCIVAADVFVYIGDLEPVFSAAAAVSAKG
jgi:predicted TPR repeat methyltransferase